MKHLLALLATFATSALIGPAQAQQLYGFNRDLDVPVHDASSQLANPWVGGLNSVQFSTIDLDLDGVLDLFGWDMASQRAVTYLNMGTSGQVDYKYAPQYESQFPNFYGSSWVRLADYNCDGKEDIFTNISGSAIRVYTNISDTNGLQWEIAPGQPFNFLWVDEFPNYVNLSYDTYKHPIVDDMDGDGDLDILAYYFVGSNFRYYRNMSMENFGICDSLHFTLKNECWGHFLEGNDINDFTLFDTCTYTNVVGTPELQPKDQIEHHGQADQTERTGSHIGIAMVSLDLNDDGVRDLIIGGETTRNLVSMINDGTGVNLNTSMVVQDTAFPSNTTQPDLFMYPAPFYWDVDNDGAKDLVAPTHLGVNSSSKSPTEDINGTWLFTNSGTNTNPTFNYQKDNFLQEDMIDVGISALPTLFDHDDDGLLDLFIGNDGAFDRNTVTHESTISHYQNIGTATDPEFQLVTNDYQNISSIGFPNGICPTFGDLNNDGAEDMIIGDANGNIHYFVNTAPAGSAASFTLAAAMLGDNDAITIDVGDYAMPVLVDLDRDGLLDLIIGCKAGNIYYFQNIGTQSVYAFKEITPTLGNVDVSTIYDFDGGWARPSIWDNNGEYELVVGSHTGGLWHYDSLENNLGGTFRLLSDTAFGIEVGRRVAPTLGLIDDDTIPDLILGNHRGGVAYFTGADTSTIIEPPDDDGIKDYLAGQVNVYPVPAGDQIIVDITKLGARDWTVEIYDMLGQRVFVRQTRQALFQAEISHLSSGYYTLNIYSDRVRVNKPFIKR